MITLIQPRSGEIHLVDYTSVDGTRHRTICRKRYSTSQLSNTFDLDSPIAVVCKSCYKISDEVFRDFLKEDHRNAKGELYEHLCRNYRHIQMGARDTETFYSSIVDDKFVQMMWNLQKLFERQKNPKLWKWYAR